jgi:hypothetical protein
MVLKPNSKQSEVDERGSSRVSAGRARLSSLGKSRTSQTRRVSFLGIVGLVTLSALGPGCAEFDTQRALPPRASVAQEMYGVLCDRVAAQALREDLSGDSFHAICHANDKGEFSDTVDESKLPPIRAGLLDEKGAPVAVEKQQADRKYALARIGAFARRRDDLIRALEATFPSDKKVPVKDIDNPDPTQSCEPGKDGGQGLLTTYLADMLGRMADLYNDGTIPQSTESLARVVDAFKNDADAQSAWQRVSARQGYRPIDTALGALRPIIAYPNLRDFSNASLRLLSADSEPYAPNPQRDRAGNRIPVPGPGNAALNKLLEVSHQELLAATADPKPALLTTSVDPSGRVVLSRPRDNLEMLQEILYLENDAFANGSTQYIVRRDPRGYAKIRDGEVPAPFVDANNDGLPDIDAVGRFKTDNGSVAPAPFAFPFSTKTTRDKFDRATAAGGLLYDYIDTSRTFAAQVTKDTKALVNSDPKAQHETLMDLLGGLPIVMGPRADRTKKYGDTTIKWTGPKVDTSPMLDLVYALGVILGDKSIDDTLGMAKELFTSKQAAMARVTGAMTHAFDVAQKHPEASIPRNSTFWDENIEVLAKIAAEGDLLEGMLRAMSRPETQKLGDIYSKYASFKDQISYDINDLNGDTYNVTRGDKSEMQTPVDRTKPYTGENRSALFRFLRQISDTAGVASCNKDGAKLNLVGIEVPFKTFKRCEVFKIDNLGAFYVDAMVNAAQYDGNKTVPRGMIYMRPSFLRAAPTNTSTILEQSSGIKGFWAEDLATPTPKFLDRLTFFDFDNDHTNTKTRQFISDLNGELTGSSVCEEETITDPVSDAADRNPDGMIHGLRKCKDGEYLQQRNKNTIFTFERFGFFDAMTPLVTEFVTHNREDLFLELSAIAAKHYPGKEATDAECTLAGGAKCPRDGASSYEAIIAETFTGDLFPAIGAIVEALDNMPIKSCVRTDSKGACIELANTDPPTTGLMVAARAARAALTFDPKLTDRHGSTKLKRNDGSTIPQASPAYLLTNALFAIDLAFDEYEKQNPGDKERRAGWRRARSQLVDQFMATKTTVDGSASFENPTIPNTAPALIDLLRSQLWAHCPRSFVPPYERCTWTRDELLQKATETLAGPLATTGIDVMDTIRQDPDARRETEKLFEYLLDGGSKNEALPNLLASTSDLLQVLRDDENLVPLYKVLATAVDGSKYDDDGKLTEKSLVDAQMAFLARISGKYFDANGKELCKNEVDPNQLLATVLANVVTPIKEGKFEGQSPLEVIMDVIADVNRIDPSEKYDGTLLKKDYGSVSTNVVEFLTDPRNGLEQFYEVIRQGTRF